MSTFLREGVVESQVSKSAKPFDFAQGRLWGTRRYLDVSFIALILPFTSFFTNVIGIGSLIGKLTMAFVVEYPASSFLCFSITGGRTCRRIWGFLKLNQANIPS